jgi:hypothetical protein
MVCAASMIAVSGAPPADAIDAPIDAPASGIQFVQGAYASSQTDVNTLSVVMPMPQTAGSINVVFVSWFSTDGLSTLTDTQGIVYQQRINPPGGSIRMSAYTSAPLAQGGNTVTVTFTGPSKNPELRVLEYRGVSTTNPIGMNRRNQSSGNTCSVNIDTSTAGEVVVVGNTADGVDTLTLSTGFTERMRTVPGQHVVGDAKPMTPGQLNPTVGLTGSAAWVMEAITLRP